jgi:hypothetical protein
VQVAGNNRNISIALTVPNIGEFQDLIHNMSLTLMFKGQFNVVYDWSRLPDTLQRTVQTHPCWRVLHEKFSKSGLLEQDGMTSRGTAMDRPTGYEISKAPSTEFDFFSPSDMDEVVSAKHPPIAPPKSEKLTKVPSGERPKSSTQSSPRQHVGKPTAKTPPRLSREEIDKHAREASNHIRMYGGNPPMLVSSTSKVLQRATNYVRDQLNLRNLDDASLEAIVARLEQMSTSS